MKTGELLTYVANSVIHEEKVVKLKLTYHLDESGMAQIENNTYVLATKDIDEKIIDTFEILSTSYKFIEDKDSANWQKSSKLAN